MRMRNRRVIEVCMHDCVSLEKDGLKYSKKTMVREITQTEKKNLKWKKESGE